MELEHKSSGKVSIMSYTIPCVLEANVNQVIPSFSMMLKSMGSFLLFLILNLSLTFIMTSLGKFTLLPLS